MKISRLIASFGRLRGEELLPGPGLNIICAPNEGGKTTWCAFLRAMLFGIDTKERDTKTSLADKNRWQPWSGAPMEGELDMIWQGRGLVLRRFPKGNTPFGGFSAADAATGENLAGMTAANAGETLLGVSRSVYERSAFIGQGGIPFTGERELEKRIAALVSSGEEDVSYSQVEGLLRQWQRRRKYNKAGLIPRLEGELAALDGALERMERARFREEAARRETERLEKDIMHLEAQQELHRRIARREMGRRYIEAQADLEKAATEEQALREQWADVSQRVPKDACFPDMTPEEALYKANSDAISVTEHQKAAGRAMSLLALLSVMLGAILLWLWRSEVLDQVLFCAFAAVPLAVGLLLAVRHRKAAGILLARYGVWTPEDIVSRAAAYKENSMRADELRRNVQSLLSAAAARREGAQKLLDVLTEQGALPREESEAVEIPERTAEETHMLLVAARGELSRAHGDLAMARGELNTMDDPAALEARHEKLREELARRRNEYDALTMALEELSAANSELQARFSPLLNARAGELMVVLTGGKYDKIMLTRDFQATAAECGGILPRPAMSLSQGTADQLYLAVRLAICELALPAEEPAPLVLDDALASFDQARMSQALELLREIGKTRQILLFTCHSREKEYLKGKPDVTLIDLHFSES